MKKIFFLILFLTGLFGFVNANTSYYNFAYITGTAYLNFNGEVDGVSYNVKVDDSQIFYVTGNDNKIYHCFKLVGTGYTDTLGEVYFGFNGYDSYSCADGKLRGYANISAGGRIFFEDFNLGDGENWKVSLNEKQDVGDSGFFYHSKDGKGNGNATSFSLGIGIWDWSLAKTKEKSSSMIYDYIDYFNTDILVGSGALANGIDKIKLTLNIKDFNNKHINGLYIENINFGIIDSDFVYNFDGEDKSVLYFKDLKDSFQFFSLPNGVFINDIVSILNLSGSFNLNIVNYNHSLKITGTTFFNSPVDIDFELKDGDSNGKLLIGDQEVGKFKLSLDSNISNLEYFGELNFSGKYNYRIIDGKTNYDLVDFPIKILPSDKNIDNKLGLYYKISGVYDLSLPSYGLVFSGLNYTFDTNINYIYPDKKIDNIDIVKKDCDGKYGNGKDLCTLIINLYNSKGYKIPFLGFKLEVNDANILNIDKYTTFDINELNSEYTTGFFYTSNVDHTNEQGESNFSFYSYKPVFGGKLKFTISDISNYISGDIYNWEVENTGKKVAYNKTDIFFDKIVDLYFSGAAFENGVAINENNEVGIVFEKIFDLESINNGKYLLTGSIVGCTDCKFVSGQSFTDNKFASVVKTIVLTGSETPDYIQYYQQSYSYNLTGLNGNKLIILQPNVQLNGKGLNIIGQFFGLKLFGIINRGYNYYNLEDVGLIGSNVPFSVYVSDIEKQLISQYRGRKFDNISSDLKIDLFDNFGVKFYECNGSKIILESLTNKVEILGKNELILKNCEVHIKSNIFKVNNDSILKITSFSDKILDFGKDKGWEMKSNFYIYPNVSTIFINIITNGSVLFPSSETLTDDIIFIPLRWNRSELKKQIYIKGKIMSRNTLGGGFIKDSSYVLPGGKKIGKDELIFNQSSIKPERYAQGYDIQFWRASYVKNGKYSTGSLSEVILGKYGCSGNITDDKICTKPVVFEHE